MAATNNINRKDYNKIGTEDDPVIIAQRFLNIFRQLHIFSPERKAAFNSMILEQPAEIRGMFGSLPGGAVLQQYVDDLEAASGINRDMPGGTLQSGGEQPQILAEALADTQSPNTTAQTAQVAAVAAAQAAAAVQAQIQAAQNAIPHNAAPAAGPATIVADKSFAKDIADALKEAIIYVEKSRPQTYSQPQYQTPPPDSEQPAPAFTAAPASDANLAREIVSALKDVMISSDQQRRTESAQLAKAIVESQGKIAKMLVQNNTANNAANNNANNIQINTAASFPPVDEMVKGIAKTQMALFREMAQTQTREISAIISVALKESQQLSNKAMIEAIREMQKENLKFLQSRPVVYTAAPAAMAPMPQETAKEAAAPQTDPLPEPAVPETNNTIPLDIFGDEQVSAPAEEEQAADFAEDAPAKKKKKKKNSSEGLSLDGLASSLMDKVSSLTDKVSSLSGKKVIEPTTENVEEKLTESAIPTFDDMDFAAAVPQDNSLDESLFDDHSDDLPDLSFSKAEEETPLAEEPQAEPAAEQIISEEAVAEEPVWEKVASPETESVAEAGVEAEPMPEAEEEIEPEQISEPEQLQEEEIAIEPFNEPEEPFVPEPPAEETLPEETPEEFLPSSAYDDIAVELPPLDSEELNAEDWGLTPAPEPAEGENEDNEELLASEETAPAEMQAATDSAEEEWEWEYEEVPEGEETAPVETQAATDSAEEEWEWEYEEVPEGEETAPVETQAATDSTEEEWEWEYEEVPEGEEAVPIEAQDASDGAEEEWEWEYEEVPEGEENTPIEAQDASDGAEEEWEWEYEEVPEGEENAPIEAQDASDGAEEEWEWEYEEVPEGEAGEETAPAMEAAAGEEPLEEAPADNFNLLKETAAADMYNISAENIDPYNPEVPDEQPKNNLSSIYTGEVYFQEQVYDQNNPPANPAVEIPEGLPGNLGITEGESADNPGEPYKPQD